MVTDTVCSGRILLAFLLQLVSCTESISCPRTANNSQLSCTYITGGYHDDAAPFCLCASDIPAVEIGTTSSLLVSTWPQLREAVEMNFTISPLETMFANDSGLITIGPYGVENATLTELRLTAVRTGKSFFKFTNESENVFVNWKDVIRQADVVHSLSLNVLAAVVGWSYFFCWTISFYPQPLLNCYRRSVVGLNIDSIVLSVVGYIGYLVFNLSLFFSPAVQDQYFLRHPGGINPVRINDVAFCIHSMILSSLVLLQVVYLQKGQQKLSKVNKVILVVIFIVLYVCALLSVGNNVIKWLDYLYIMSYTKLFINIIKDVPQIWQIYRTKTTAGYSMLGIWIDLAGGLLSLLQMFILAYNYDDWSSLFGDPTKFGLGVFSILTDFIVMYQHYVQYGAKEKNGQNPETMFLKKAWTVLCPCVALPLKHCFKKRKGKTLLSQDKQSYGSTDENTHLIQ